MIPVNKTVRVELPATARDYEIVIGSTVLAEAGNIIESRLGKRRCVVITDVNVAAIYLRRLEAILTAAGHNVLSAVTIPAGEGSKDFSTLWCVLNELFERGVDRKTLVIALGGGVIGDLSGLAASLALRGLDIVQIPTTLLAQVDSSVGGKTGINSPYGKNTVGAFYQPRLVLADVTTLDSLPRRETLSGYAEIVKYGLIGDAKFFKWCEAHGGKLAHGDREAQIYAISRSCEEKARIVAADEREIGERALLNLGHTFGHALETVTGYGETLLHGEAVAIGTVMAFQLSANLGLCPREDAEAVRNHFKSVGLPVAPPKAAAPETYDLNRLMMLMAQDKKAQRGKLTLVMPRRIGEAFVSNDVDPAPIRELWKATVMV